MTKTGTSSMERVLESLLLLLRGCTEPYGVFELLQGSVNLLTLGYLTYGPANEFDRRCGKLLYN